jgi:hypothetical protein
MTQFRMTRKNQMHTINSLVETPAKTTGILDDYTDMAGIAAEFGLSPFTIVRWRLAGKGPPLTKIDRKFF